MNSYARIIRHDKKFGELYEKAVALGVVALQEGRTEVLSSREITDIVLRSIELEKPMYDCMTIEELKKYRNAMLREVLDARDDLYNAVRCRNMGRFDPSGDRLKMMMRAYESSALEIHKRMEEQGNENN